MGYEATRSFFTYGRYLVMKSSGVILREQRVQDDIYFTYEEAHAVGYGPNRKEGEISVQRWESKGWTRDPEPE